MRRVKTAVPMDECKRRVLAFIRKEPKRLHKASEFACEIWPDSEFTAQGAGAAASRILKALEKDNLVEWISSTADWGWRLR